MIDGTLGDIEPEEGKLLLALPIFCDARTDRNESPIPSLEDFPRASWFFAGRCSGVVAFSAQE
jgi:hypothetical protein